jgi:hypothetical protein
MTEPSNATAVVRAEALSIVLFGLPAAGKSSLLGALAQAAQTQEHLLNGRLSDVSHGLDQLRRHLDRENTHPTTDEVVLYPVDFEPFRADGPNSKTPPHVWAVFIDCAGCVANNLLVRRQAVAEDGPAGALAHEINNADALVLVIDASAPPAQVEANFAEFERFLQEMESQRSRRIEVNGLPVFLVLTKCDLLARPGDTTADWMERIEQYKRDLDRRFCSFLTRRSSSTGGKEEEDLPPFGRIELHLWATAVKQPVLAGAPAKACELYGVAELFRQCLEQAAAFRRRRRQAGRRLVWTTAASGSIIALMAALAIAFAIHNLDTPLNVLRERVQIFRGSDMPSEAERLHAPLRELRGRAEELRDIRNDPHFGVLPAVQQQLVCDRLAELEAYLHYFDRLVQSPRPRDVHSLEALHEIEETLKTALAVPKEAWRDTEAGQLCNRRLQEAKALALAVKQAEDWYRDHAVKAEELWTFSRLPPGRDAVAVNWDRWTADAETLLHPDFRPPSYQAVVLGFEEVRAARIDWEEKKNRLQRVFDICTALGLATPAASRRGVGERGGVGVLAIPRRFALSQSRERRNDLELSYPHYKKDLVFENVPEAIRPLVDQAAHVNYERLLAPAQAAVQKQLEQGDGSTEETRARWENVRRWLRDPKELEDWRVLAGVLIRLHDPSSAQAPESADPVNGLADFLDRTSFSLNIRQLTLEIPEKLERKPVADTPLAIYHPASAGNKPALVLQLSNEGERDPQRRVWTYHFRLRRSQTLTYRPGDALWATLPLRDDWAFTWVRCRSSLYQFERLVQPPQLHHRQEAAAHGTLAEEVRLIITPADGVPRLPDLMPVVRLPAQD